MYIYAYMYIYIYNIIYTYIYAYVVYAGYYDLHHKSIYVYYTYAYNLFGRCWMGIIPTTFVRRCHHQLAINFIGP